MRLLLVIIVVCALLFCTCKAIGVPPTQEQWNIAIQKAKDYLTNSSFTNTEKVALTTGVGWQKGACVGNIPAITRVNFTGFCLEDSPTGVRFAKNVSGFPAAINVAATWNRTLIYDRSAAMGAEFKTKGAHIALTPMMNMGRVAAGGRNWEGFGADPYLTGEAAYLSVLGIQDQGVVATAKHYLLNEQEHYRTTSTSNADTRTLHEIYMWPFMHSVRAGVGSVMCSYNLVNGVYACENEYILNEVLKKELGFQGYVMSDWSATMSGVPSVLAGLDMTMPGDVTMGSGTTYFGSHLVSAVANGQVSQARLDDMAARILTPFFLFEQDQNFPTVDFDFRNSAIGNKRDAQADHAELIRRIGAESNILLKNINNVLPFSVNISGDANYTFAVVGSDAGPSPGSYGPTACADHGCNIGTLAQGWGSGTVWFPYLIDPNAAIVNQTTLNNQTIVSYLNDSIAPAVQAASQANIAIVFVSADSGEGYILVENNYGDRNDLNLWHNGNALIQAVAAVNSRTIVVMHVVGPVLMPWIDHPNISAVILAGLPGQESGNSLVDVLFGTVNPSAKLVYTIAKQATDYPASVLYSSGAQHPVINYSEQLLIDYRWFDQKNITPQFEFGFGLSYTTFEYSNLQLTPVESSLAGCVAHQTIESAVVYTATVDVTNTGSYDGAEIVQLYLAFPPTAGEPPKVLRGFDKVWVPQSGKAQVSFTLTRVDISIWDTAAEDWVVPAGTFGVLIGASSRDIRLNTSFSVDAIPSVSTSFPSTIVEGSSLTIPVSLSATSSQTIYVPLLVTYISATASDVTVSPLCIVFDPNTLQSNFTITALDNNNVYQPNKTFNISLQTPTHANLASGDEITVTIQDNDEPQVSIGSSQFISVGEGVGVVNITLLLTHPSVFTTSVAWSLTGHPNFNDIVFNNPFIIPPFVLSATLQVKVTQDNIYEGINETFVLTIANTTNSTFDSTANTVSITVIDDDPIPTISLWCISTTLSISSSVSNLQIVLSNPEEGEIGLEFLIDYANTSISDVSFAGITGFPNVTIPTNKSSLVLNISGVFDGIYEGNEFFAIALANVTSGVATIGSNNSVQFEIVENIPMPSVFFPESSTVAQQANTTAYILISLSNPALLPIEVPFTLSAQSAAGPDIATGTVNFPSLSVSQKIPIYIEQAWTSDATIVLSAPSEGPAFLGSVSTFTIYNNYSIPITITTATIALPTSSTSEESSSSNVVSSSDVTTISTSTTTTSALDSTTTSSVSLDSTTTTTSSSSSLSSSSTTASSITISSTTTSLSSTTISPSTTTSDTDSTTTNSTTTANPTNSTTTTTSNSTSPSPSPSPASSSESSEGEDMSAGSVLGISLCVLVLPFVIVHF